MPTGSARLVAGIASPGQDLLASFKALSSGNPVSPAGEPPRCDLEASVTASPVPGIAAGAMLIPVTLADGRTIACGPPSGARASRAAGVFAIALICSPRNASRAMSRRNSSLMFARRSVPSAVRRSARRSARPAHISLESRTPRRVSALFMRLVMRERSCTRARGAGRRNQPRNTRHQHCRIHAIHLRPLALACPRAACRNATCASIPRAITHHKPKTLLGYRS
jgi:hypothetical protein